MRCKVCDYSPTAPSLSLPIAPQGVKLVWDKVEGGWTCGNSCGKMDSVEYDEMDLDFVETAESETTLSQM